MKEERLEHLLSRLLSFIKESDLSVADHVLITSMYSEMRKAIEDQQEELTFLKAYKKKANENIQNLMGTVDRQQKEIELLKEKPKLHYGNCKHENLAKEQSTVYCSDCGLIMQFTVEHWGGIKD